MDYRKQKDKNEIGGKDNSAFAFLVLKASKGNSEALAELCQSIVKGVLFRTTRILGNQEGAEDVAQEVLIRVCSHVHELRDPSAFYAWLNCIIINETNRYMTKNSRHGVVLNIDDYQDAFEEMNDDFLPPEHSIKESDRRKVVEIIDSLPEQQRKAVLLYYYDGMTLTEAAKVMSVSQPRVSRCIKMAQDKIRNELNKWTQGAEGAAFGLSMIPLDAMLAQVLQHEASLFANMNAGWADSLIGAITAKTSGAVTGSAAAGGAAAGGAAAGGAVAAAKGAGLGASGGKMASASNNAGTIATLAAAAVVAAGVLFIAPTLQETPEPPPVIAAEYTIDFSGGDAGREYVNPTEAVAFVSTDVDDMKANCWWITSEDDEDTILCSGDGGVVKNLLQQMPANTETGVYALFFEMEDRNGDTWTLKRYFVVEK